MKFFVKGLCAAFLMAVSFSYAQAAAVNFTLTGTVYNTYENDSWYGPNPFGLHVGDTITATATFDDSLINNYGSTLIDFGDSDISMLITVGNTVYTDDDDFSGGAWLYFYNDDFDGLSYSSNFCCDFYGDDFDGQWTSMAISPVPVPAAVWLFGSGLIGLVGFAKRNKSQILA